MPKYIYSSNNSGGDWWLDLSHWTALENAGWEVEWGRLYFCRHSPESEIPNYWVEPCPEYAQCQGHRRFTSHTQMTDKDLFLRSYAFAATKEFSDIELAIEEFQEITGLDYYDQGCPCCGAPHSIWETT